MNHSSTKYWLWASMVLNLFLAGGIAGGAWRWWSAERVHAAPSAASSVAPPRGLRFAADELNADQRKAYRQGLRDARQEAAPLILAAREGRQEVLRLIAAPQLDAAAVSAALARTREADAALRTRVEGSVVEFAATLSLEDRQKLSSGLARRTPLNTPANSTAPAAKP